MRKLRSNHLATALRQAREEAGLGQVAISSSLGYEYNVVSAWENGSKRIYLREWPLLCDLLPSLDRNLADKHSDELAAEERKLPARPSRLDARVAGALADAIELRFPGRAITEVASEAEIDYIALWKILKGKSNPTIEQLHKLSDLLDMDVDQLLGRRPIEGASYARIKQLLLASQERVSQMELTARDGERIRQLNDLLLNQQESKESVPA